MKKKLIIFVLGLICWGLYILGFFSSYPYLLDFTLRTTSKFDTFRNVMEYSIMFFSLLLFCAYLMRKNIILKIFVVLLLLVLSANFMLSASCLFIYKQGFNVGMMMSILDTNVEESVSMSKTLVEPILLTVVFFTSVFLFVKLLSKYLSFSSKQRWIGFLFASLWLIMPYGYYLKHKYISNKGGGFMIKSVYYHALNFIAAKSLNDDLKAIRNINIDYHLEKTGETPQKTIVLIIGESERRQNMSLYGYKKRNTTPIETAEKSHMELYTAVHSPAAITNLAVPLILSNVDINDYQRNVSRLNDNIINVANYLGYNTFWYSTQGAAQGITPIASMAKNKKWIGGYDEALLPYLSDALRQKGKKLIVLHIMGSHPDSCDKYPASEQKWKGGIDECYDNSILYTDKVIGKVLDKIRKQDAVLVYLSDHGQTKKDGIYSHGDYKEETQIPFYIWYSNLADPKHKHNKVINNTISSTILYSKILDLMGVRNPNTVDNSSKYLKLNLEAIDYKDLK